MKKSVFLFTLLFVSAFAFANDGHSLWLGRFAKQPDNITTELVKGSVTGDGFRLTCTTDGHVKVVAATQAGLIYGRFEAQRMQALGTLHAMDSTFVPAFKYRLLNHWDNLDGSIERGYAGRSIFWSCNLRPASFFTRHPSPQAVRLNEYAKANASVGINGVVLNNVNASPKMLTKAYIDSVRMIANILRPWGIRVYLSVNFGMPKALGYTSTADPLDPQVRLWWRKKADEIYKMIPDFGGFLVKANSEGQPGPFDYGRSHADGANMLADALKPHGGIVMWRSFVYGAKHKGEDRVMQAVSEFKDLDGQFSDNVILQSKNGPLDFQPREPYAPIFDNMQATQQMAEFQITQEYTGQSKHLVYLGTMWKEFFHYVCPQKLLGIAGVSNVGSDENWCGHDFSQANWYAFGRLAWNPNLTAEQIASEWIGLTFNNNPRFVDPVRNIMMRSREDCVDYMMPLGLHHIFKFDHHYGPEPDGFKAEYPIEWCPVYYHKADSLGIGFNRTNQGSGAVNQYREPYKSLYNDINTCPDRYLLWFHHVAWNYVMSNGLTLWDNIQQHYNQGVSAVEAYLPVWQGLKALETADGDNDGARWNRVAGLLKVQADNAREWRDVCLNYFGQFAHKAPRNANSH